MESSGEIQKNQILTIKSNPIHSIVQFHLYFRLNHFHMAIFSEFHFADADLYCSEFYLTHYSRRPIQIQGFEHIRTLEDHLILRLRVKIS